LYRSTQAPHGTRLPKELKLCRTEVEEATTGRKLKRSSSALPPPYCRSALTGTCQGSATRLTLPLITKSFRPPETLNTFHLSDRHITLPWTLANHHRIWFLSTTTPVLVPSSPSRSTYNAVETVIFSILHRYQTVTIIDCASDLSTRFSCLLPPN
jgi:hypothetical protein